MAEKRKRDDDDDNMVDFGDDSQDGAGDGNPDLHGAAIGEPNPGADGIVAEANNPDIIGDESWPALWEALQCPTCLDIANPPIVQCRRGHNICSNCKKNVPACPLCGAAYQDTRNFTMEALIDKVALPCRYIVDGCTFKGRKEKKRDHEKTCDKQPFFCPADNCRQAIRSDDILDHLKKQHLLEMRDVTHKVNGDSCEESLTLRIPPPKTQVYSHVMNMLNIKEWGVFLLVASVHPAGTVSWIIQILASKNKAKEFVYRLAFSGLTDLKSELTYAGSVPSLSAPTETVLEDGFCVKTTPIFLLSTSQPYEEGKCKLSLRISKRA